MYIFKFDVNLSDLSKYPIALVHLIDKWKFCTFIVKKDFFIDNRWEMIE